MAVEVVVQPLFVYTHHLVDSATEVFVQLLVGEFLFFFVFFNDWIEKRIRTL